MSTIAPPASVTRSTQHSFDNWGHAQSLIGTRELLQQQR
jgi:hypothetical protein